MKHGVTRWYRIILLGCLFGILPWLHGCQSRSGGTDGVVADLSGTYYLENLGQHQPGEFPNPLIDFTNIRLPATVTIRHSDVNTVEAAYIDAQGQPVTVTQIVGGKTPCFAWQEGKLMWQQRVAVEGPIILPGYAKHTRGVIIGKDAGGDLTITGTFTEKGMMLFVVPFTDHSESALILKRVE